ncbi:MAG TPA: flagellar basal body L-ring protein FlgH [Candidatus Atribacteria bacterium]|jgi:flagellar L-ring protein precursor FlgH|uniref:flagellar basal body L-ring protein FlgH n=1 Tax=Candidatus Sordicultor fermentans TaxID=1953203 RepID=UPI0016B9A47A|nr:flagellar basal body L-ring protein FlgH [Atribacterota bacterium]NLY04616.1 flagellar basal body L-ring protein FlgH [Candidatus Atribacteria bacterium]MDI9606972.1 flagellar basal body L-ring protein FlgH [Atribacterota bacterium]HOA99246.1 flagellar basal body L-ring protein FlgH [Candidatus Atribacteria bacterium]HOQ51193.1 flagellar basal body L-ring protein FlgH [Candidatus Atribacteria bacterium]
MKRVTAVFFMVVFVSLFFFSEEAKGESLWQDEGWFSDPYSDYRASRVGDTVTVIINENTKGKNSASSDSNKQTSIGLKAGQGIFDFVPPATLESGNSRGGSRDYGRSISLSGTITCQVTEVLEGGNLRIAGSKEIYLNKERETLSIEGVVNPRYIGADNSVYSTQVVDAVIKLDGTLKPEKKSGLAGLLEGVFGSIMDILF